LSLGDPGYQFFNWLAHAVGADIWLVNVACAAIFSWGLIRFAKSQPNPWLAVLVAVPYLILVVGMGYSRQAVAIGIIMAGMAGFRERPSLIRFTLYIGLAALFHKTAVIVLPLVAVSSDRSRFVNGLLVVVLGYGMYKLFLEASTEELYTNYVEYEYSSQGAAIRVAMNLLPAALFLVYQKRFELPEWQRRLWRNSSVAALGLLVLLAVLPSSTVVDRLALYVIPLQLFVLSRLPDAFPSKGRRNGQLVLLVILYSALVQFVWLNYATHAKYWLPYKVYPFFDSEAEIRMRERTEE
jgi:hypothetical protein